MPREYTLFYVFVEQWKRRLSLHEAGSPCEHEGTGLAFRQNTSNYVKNVPLPYFRHNFNKNLNLYLFQSFTL